MIILRCCPSIFLEKLRNITENHSQSRRGSKLRPVLYESGVMSSQLLHSITPYRRRMKIVHEKAIHMQGFIRTPSERLCCQLNFPKFICWNFTAEAWLCNFRKIAWFSRQSISSFRNLLTNFMEQSPTWEAHSLSRSQEIPPPPLPVWNPKFHYRVHKSSPPVPILSPMYPVHVLPPISFVHFSIIFTSTSSTYRSFQSFRPKFYVCFLSLPCMLHAPFISFSLT